MSEPPIEKELNRDVLLLPDPTPTSMRGSISPDPVNSPAPVSAGHSTTAVQRISWLDEVRVVEVPGVSMELCGGTRVTNTSEIRGFKIIDEQGVASGIRRIEAVAGDAFIEYVTSRDYHMKQLCSTLKVVLMLPPSDESFHKHISHENVSS